MIPRDSGVSYSHSFLFFLDCWSKEEIQRERMMSLHGTHHLKAHLMENVDAGHVHGPLSSKSEDMQVSLLKFLPRSIAGCYCSSVGLGGFRSLDHSLLPKNSSDPSSHAVSAESRRCRCLVPDIDPLPDFWIDF
ncbi:hypothetical protein BDZ45DRAFT_78393 [Acephala macrosclerotiorum]|nr:hypothetical protein BDZ45DRAFT_78393 [Acephala macrosclerotiorum]